MTEELIKAAEQMLADLVYIDKECFKMSPVNLTKDEIDLDYVQRLENALANIQYRAQLYRSNLRPFLPDNIEEAIGKLNNEDSNPGG